MKILNLYSCLGGNSYKLDETALEIERKENVKQTTIFDI